MGINVQEYTDRLLRLYERQLATSNLPYLKSHCASRGAVLRQVEAARLYLPHVRGRVLDWGCFHAPDACLVRMHHGDAVELHGCDVVPGDLFPVFFEAARLKYRQIRHPYQLPYDDNFFDTIIADGVLEHVPNDRESLKELYRILKPGGMLIVACLPNAASYIENVSRLLNLPYHLRAYSMRSARSLLLHSGFEPVCQRYLQMVPSLSGLAYFHNLPAWLKRTTSALWVFNALLERLWPVNKLSSNLFLIARKYEILYWLPRKQAA